MGAPVPPSRQTGTATVRVLRLTAGTLASARPMTLCTGLPRQIESTRAAKRCHQGSQGSGAQPGQRLVQPARLVVAQLAHESELARHCERSRDDHGFSALS